MQTLVRSEVEREALRIGRHAAVAQRGMAYVTNPYPHATPQWQAWREGFNQKFAELRYYCTP